jgi:ubiquinone/menaquinone biosynthesis C-methylase UbiE
MKEKTYYGFPLSYIFLRVVFVLFLALIFVLLGITGISLILLFLSFILIFSLTFYFLIFHFKKRFIEKRKIVLRKIIDLADLKGNEKVLDIGTGSGFLAIGISKYIKDGKIIGLDKYNLKSNNLKTQITTIIKTNFIGNKLDNAQENLIIENVKDKCSFVEADITNPLEFKDKYFDIIVSSQLLYCLDKNKRKNVYRELDRVLKNKGKLIFFESKSFLNWSITEVNEYFRNKGYKINILQSDVFKSCCILFGEKKVTPIE